LANASAVRDWPSTSNSHSLIAITRPLYVDEPFGVDLKESVYALDTTTIDLFYRRFRGRPFARQGGGQTAHPAGPARQHSNFHISDDKMHDVNILDQLLPEPGTFYVMDRGFLDFERL
jgi:hypothetical protein